MTPAPTLQERIEELLHIADENQDDEIQFFEFANVARSIVQRQSKALTLTQQMLGSDFSKPNLVTQALITMVRMHRAADEHAQKAKNDNATINILIKLL